MVGIIGANGGNGPAKPRILQDHLESAEVEPGETQIGVGPGLVGGKRRIDLVPGGIVGLPTPVEFGQRKFEGVLQIFPESLAGRNFIALSVSFWL
jgi:hypothetical protein